MRIFILGVAAAVGLLFVGRASGAVVGYELRLYGSDFNSPSLQLFNRSTSARVTNVRVGIGDTRYNFDSVYRDTHSEGVAATLLAPDRIGHGQGVPSPGQVT